MKKYIDATSRASRVRMMRTGNQSVLMVEGNTDSRFFQRFVHAACTIFPCGNKRNVIDTMTVLDTWHVSGVLGIVDLDYDEVLGIPTSSANIVRTQVHDVEMMLLNSPAFHGFIAEYAHQGLLAKFEKQAGKVFRDALFDAAFVIGMVRYYCQVHSYPGNFSRTDLIACIDDTLHVDVACIVASIFKSDRALVGSVISYISRESDVLYSKRLHICQGHDAVKLLCRALDAFGDYNSKALTEGAVQGGLRLAVQSAWFVQTELYANVRDWEQNHMPFQIFLTETDLVS